MAVAYAYRARTRTGEMVEGTMRALSRSEALGGLRERDLTVIALRSSPPSFLRGLPFNTTPLRDRTAFFRAYAALEDAGVDFSTSFALLTAQATSRRFREALSAIRSGVEQRGEKLWAAMAQRPEEFSELDVAMIAAGEQAGTRKEVLEQIADVLERNERVRKRLLAVLTYPAVVLASAFGLCAYVLVSVVPQFAQLFLSFGVSPPPILRVLLAVSQGFTTWSLAVVAGLAAGLAIFAKRLYATSDGRRLVETSILRIPLVGRIVSTAAVARVSTVLAALLEAGVNQVRALEAAEAVAGGITLAAALERARRGLVAGQSASLHEALERTGRFQPTFIGFVRIGERSGKVPEMLRKLSEYYADELDALLETVPATIQTVVTFALGALVGVLVYAVYVPLTALSSSVR